MLFIDFSLGNGLACSIAVMNSRGKLEEQEKSVTVAPGDSRESNSRFLTFPLNFPNAFIT